MQKYLSYFVTHVTFIGFGNLILYGMQPVFIALAILGLWSLILSAFFVWEFKLFRKLSKSVKKGNLISVLDKVFEVEEKNTKSIVSIEKQIRGIVEEGQLHVKKIGLVRFNPFEELGGDHSFTLALLDGNENGFVLTGLHTRERTRVYIKPVKRGKSKYDLSKEEDKALKKALKE